MFLTAPVNNDRVGWRERAEIGFYELWTNNDCAVSELLRDSLRGNEAKHHQ